MAAISRSLRSHIPNLFFEPYLINIRCSLSLKYRYVIQLEVPYLKSHCLGTVGVLNSMLHHGISLDKFLVSILIPIPKGHRVDTGNSSNYRAVALSSIYGKILDNIILSVQQEELKNVKIYNSAINLNLKQLCAVPW